MVAAGGRWSSRLASDLFSARYLKQLLLKFGQLVRDKRDGLEVEIILPAAPSDAVPELSFAPANWRAQACQEADQKACLLHESLLGEHGEQVVYVEPGLARVPGEQGVGNAQQEAPDLLPPIGAKFGSKVTDCVMKELACVLKEQAPMLVWPHLHAFVRGFEVQGQSDRLAVSIIVQERACNIGAGGQADVLGHEAQGVDVACSAVECEASVFALRQDHVELAHGCAGGPFALGVC